MLVSFHCCSPPSYLKPSLVSFQLISARKNTRTVTSKHTRHHICLANSPSLVASCREPSARRRCATCCVSEHQSLYIEIIFCLLWVWFFFSGVTVMPIGDTRGGCTFVRISCVWFEAGSGLLWRHKDCFTVFFFLFSCISLSLFLIYHVALIHRSAPGRRVATETPYSYLL